MLGAGHALLPSVVAVTSPTANLVGASGYVILGTLCSSVFGTDSVARGEKQ